MLAATLLIGAAPASTIRHKQPPFSLRVPEGYTQLTWDMETLYTFVTSDPSNGTPAATVTIRALGEALPRGGDPIPPRGMDAAGVSNVAWQDHPLSLYALRIVNEKGEAMEARAVRVPLVDSALLLEVLVPADREATADAILATFLGGLRGESSWGRRLSDADRRDLIVMGSVPIALALLMAGIVAALAVRARRRRAALAAKGPSFVSIYAQRAEATHWQSVRLGLVTVAFAFLALIGVACLRIAFAPERPLTTDVANAAQWTIIDVAQQAIVLGFGVYGASLLLAKLRRKKPAPPPPPGGTSPEPEFQIVDDR